MTHDLHPGHVLEVLPALPGGLARTCVTSPPYWGLRDYGLPPSRWPAIAYAPMPGLPALEVAEWSGCLGLEPDPFAFVGHIVQVFREVRRVLAEDGTLWCNLGDCWASGPPGSRDPERWPAQSRSRGSRPGSPKHAGGATLQEQPNRRDLPGLKPKDLLGIPWRVAWALQADGWFLRSEIIWHKPNPMPESVRDRPTKAHEQVFLLSKSERYFYDAAAIAEPAVFGSRGSHFHTGKTAAGREHIRPVGKGPRKNDGFRIRTGLAEAARNVSETRNKRSVWTIPTQPFSGAHFATMPPELARLCILAGSAPGDVVLDPFCGAGTTGLVANREGRGFLGVELSESYCQLARERWKADAPLLMSGGGR